MTLTDEQREKLDTLWRLLLAEFHARLTDETERPSAHVLNCARLFLSDNGIVLAKNASTRLALRNLIDQGSSCPFPSDGADDDERPAVPERIGGLKSD